MTQAAKVALLVGAGDAIGAAVARRFACGGFAVCIARRDAAQSRALVEEIRSEGGEARAYSTDARKEENVKALFAEVEGDVGPIEVCLFNAGSNVSKPLLDTSEKLFFKAWELACYGFWSVGRRQAT
jgi:NAD(P)-dependent dehydrogenase (short-subunit alcohol dehydrogenase family)